MKISHAELYYKKGIKLNGIPLLKYREIEIIPNVTSTAEGSVKVKIGNNEVLAGVKMEVGEPFPDTPNEGNLMVDVQLTPIASENYEFGPPSIEAIELARVTDRAIRESKCIDQESLVIKSGEKVWTIIIDLVPINVDGGLFDLFSIAAISALLTAKFPELEDDKPDYKHLSENKLKVEKIPVTTTVYKYKNYLFIDPSNDDLKIAEARLSITTVDDENIVAFQKGGEGSFTKEEIRKAVEIAFEKGKEIREVIKQVFNLK